MGGKMSRDKGSRNERAAAKEFHKWWGSDFTRTPASGGFATQKFRDNWNAAGDLVTPDESFPFCVEIKAHEDWAMEQLLRNDGCKIYKWWQQATSETPANKLPLLVFRKNHHPFYCMIEADDYAEEQFLHDNKIRYFELTLTEDLTGAYPMKVYIMLLSDLFKLEPKIWKNKKMYLTETRQMRLKGLLRNVHLPN